MAVACVCYGVDLAILCDSGQCSHLQNEFCSTTEATGARHRLIYVTVRGHCHLHRCCVFRHSRFHCLPCGSASHKSVTTITSHQERCRLPGTSLQNELARDDSTKPWRSFCVLSILPRYIRNWRWDSTKYDRSRFISQNLRFLLQNMTKFDEEARHSLARYNELKTQNNNIAKKGALYM